MKIQDTLTPYKSVEHTGIEYGVCREFNHISRCKGLRQLVHNPSDEDARFVALETPNPFTTSTAVVFYDVPAHEENRLDVIAHRYLGSASYAWVLAYFNGIEDGFTVREGQRLQIPATFSSLFNEGEVLAAIPPLQLNLGSE